MADSGANFLQFIGGFAFQTLVHLGKVANPMTGESGVDLPNAKYSIDILGILQEKTKGNLTKEEDESLANMLRDLRMTYVEVVNKSGSGGKETSEAAEFGPTPAEDGADKPEPNQG
ncbi:MAG: DUF1844 domain-containing protein [Planctomycetes bacterium]|nr:DUF1844 domain-containing protein [Planctomycetota bacterium]MCD7896238.1 DUF1844 domain-containing protein [Planctomycetaceae bacterium]